MTDLRYQERVARRAIASVRRTSRYWSSERGKPYAPKNKDHGEYHGWTIKERKPWTPYMRSDTANRQGAPGRYLHHVRSVWVATRNDQRYVIGYALCGGSLNHPVFAKKAGDAWKECPRCKFTLMLRNDEL